MAKKKKRQPKPNVPGDMAKQVQNSAKRSEAREKRQAAQERNKWKVKGASVERSLRGVQRKYFDEPAANEKKNNLFKKRAAAAASGAGAENSTFSGGLLGSYQFKAFMRYYQDYWDDAITPASGRLDKILENGDFDNLQQAWDEFATDPDNLEAMQVMQYLAENNGRLPEDSDDPLIAQLLEEQDPDYPEGMFIDRIMVKMRR